MPMFWEMPQAQVLAAVLHTETTTVAWSFGIRNLILPGQFIGLAGMPFDHARNVACQRAIEAGATHLFFLDSDVVPPRDTVLRLLAHDLPIVSGVYCRRSPPAGIPVMIRGGQWVTELPKPGDNPMIEVDVVGAGCLLISTDYLKRMPPQDPQRGRHWFCWKVDMQGLLPPGEAMSEDFTFCLASRRLGVPILVDTSIRCRHIGYAQADYASLQPLDTVA